MVRIMTRVAKYSIYVIKVVHLWACCEVIVYRQQGYFEISVENAEDGSIYKPESKEVGLTFAIKFSPERWSLIWTPRGRACGY